MGYVWCENSDCYGNSYSCADPPHLMGGWAEQMYIRPDTFVYKVPLGLSPRVAVLAELLLHGVARQVEGVLVLRDRGFQLATPWW